MKRRIGTPRPIDGKRALPTIIHLSLQHTSLGSYLLMLDLLDENLTSLAFNHDFRYRILSGSLDHLPWKLVSLTFRTSRSDRTTSPCISLSPAPWPLSPDFVRHALLVIMA